MVENQVIQARLNSEDEKMAERSDAGLGDQSV